MVNDPVADFLTRIRNACVLRKPRVRLPLSRVTRRLAQILKKSGFVHGYEIDMKGQYPVLVCELKYDEHGVAVIEGLRRESKSSRRVYRGVRELPKVRGGIGIAVISTSKGMMTDAAARQQGVGGEVICSVW
ncbi:MAG: 30S ribosomal protein S8 [Myxococcota bacterium]